VIKTRLLGSGNSESNGPKIFLNICTEEAIPNPPEVSDDALKRIIAAEDVKYFENYFIPIILSEIRDEKDKGKRVVMNEAMDSGPDSKR
jgi:PIH1 N-terminal domain